MTPEEHRTAAEALEASILHWRRILLGVDSIAGVECPLYLTYADHDTCYECPIFKKTGQPGCNGTPYSKLNYHITYTLHQSLPGRIDPSCPKCFELTYKEIDFLQDLLIQYLKDKPEEPDISSEKTVAPGKVHEIRVEVKQSRYGYIDLSWWGDPTDAPTISQHLYVRHLVDRITWEDDAETQVVTIRKNDTIYYER